jgi:alpha-tubulin suppressor-like RCC1 family protein
MSEFHDYLNNDPYVWSFLNETTNSGWHFCFARLNNSPPTQLNAYVLGDNLVFPRFPFSNSRPSTEEFPPRQTLNPINDIVDAGTCLAIPQPPLNATAFRVAIVCTSKGHLYVAGDERFGFQNDCKLFGLGPENTTDRIQGDELTPLRLGQRTKTVRNRLTRVLGENGDLEQVRFTSVTAHRHCLAALDADGNIWFSGDPCRSGFAVASQFPNDSGGLLNWFRKAAFESYEDASGTVTPSQPIAFKKIRAGVTAMIALGTDNHLYTWGTFNLGKEITSTRPHRVNAFVDSVSLVSEGSGYTSSPTVTVSAPQHPNGTRAVVQIGSIVGNRIKSLILSDPGWGYTSTPTITFSGGGGSGASATASLFSGTWLDCDAGYDEDYPRTCAAISSSGKLYLTSERYLYGGQSWSSPSSISGFTSVSLGLNHGVLLLSDGSFGFWGRSSYVKPDASSSTSSLETTSLPGKTVIRAKAFETGYAILTDDGRIYTAGENAFAGRGTETYNGSRFVPLNSSTSDGVSKARFSDIFGTRLATFLCRIESRDEFGNLIDPLTPGLPS